MKRRFLIAGLAALATFSGAASANTVCYSGMIRNAYGFVLYGVANTGAACADTGTLTFTSQTAVSVKASENCNNGASSSFTGTGTYTLASDCIGSATITTSTGYTSTYKFTVVDGGGSMYILVTVPGWVGTGTGVKT
jgi:hypothetical protein